MTARPCLDCGTPTSQGNRCPTCAPAAEEARQRAMRRQRGTTRSRGYDTDWQRVSRAVIRADPQCTVCGTSEDLTTDHVIPISAGGARLDRDNLQVLCRSHHAVKTADDRWGER